MTWLGTRSRSASDMGIRTYGVTACLAARSGSYIITLETRPKVSIEISDPRRRTFHHAFHTFNISNISQPSTFLSYQVCQSLSHPSQCLSSPAARARAAARATYSPSPSPHPHPPTRAWPPPSTPARQIHAMPPRQLQPRLRPHHP